MLLSTKILFLFLEHCSSNVSASLHTPNVPGSSPRAIFFPFFSSPTMSIFNTVLIFFCLVWPPFVSDAKYANLNYN